MEDAFCYIFIDLFNKNILEYVQIAGSEPKTIILDIESRSNIYLP